MTKKLTKPNLEAAEEIIEYLLSQQEIGTYLYQELLFTSELFQTIKPICLNELNTKELKEEVSVKPIKKWWKFW